MRGGEATLTVEEKDGGNDKGAGGTGCWAARGMGGFIVTQKASGVGCMDACAFTEPITPLMRWWNPTKGDQAL